MEVRTSFAGSGLSAATTYSYTVAARDAAGNISPNSASVSISVADTTPPTTPIGLTAAVAGSSGANLSWSASTDNVGVTGYRSEEHTSELQSRSDLVCRLLLEKKKKINDNNDVTCTLCEHIPC